MFASALPPLQVRPKPVHHMGPLRLAVPGPEPSLIGIDQFTEERRRRLKNQQRLPAPALMKAAPDPDTDPTETPVDRWMYLAVWSAASVLWAFLVPEWMSRTTFAWVNGAVLVALAVSLTLRWRSSTPVA